MLIVYLFIILLQYNTQFDPFKIDTQFDLFVLKIPCWCSCHSDPLFFRFTQELTSISAHIQLVTVTSLIPVIYS
jgi:hypothetical protein